MCYIAQCSKKISLNEDLEALDAIVNNGGVENDDDDAYSDTKLFNACDDGKPQSRITNNGEGLRRSLASYLGSQKRFPP